MIESLPIASQGTEWRTLHRFMLAAVVALALTIGASTVSIAVDIHRLSVINHIVSDASSGNLARFHADLAAGHGSDHQTSVIGIVEVGLLVVAAVGFIAWFHRAYGDLLLLGADRTRHGTGWAIGGWFVPILNLWRPKQIANDIWRGSDPRRAGKQPLWRGPVSPLLWFWWAAWLIKGLMSEAGRLDWNAAVSVHALRNATRLDIAAECASVLAAGLAIAVVYTLTNRERRRAGAGDEASHLAHAETGEELQGEEPGSQKGVHREGAWYADPYGKAAERWWDGRRWTHDVQGAPKPQDAHSLVRARRAEGSVTRTRSGQTPAEATSPRSSVCPNCRGTGHGLAFGLPCALCEGRGRVNAREESVYWIFLAITFVVVGVVLLQRLL